MKDTTSAIRHIILVLALAAGGFAVLAGPTPAAHASDIGGCRSCPTLPRIHVLQPYFFSPGILEITGSGFASGTTVSISITQIWSLSQGLIAPVTNLTTTAGYYGQIDAWTFVDPRIYCNLFGTPLSAYGFSNSLLTVASDGTTGYRSNNVSTNIC